MSGIYEKSCRVCLIKAGQISVHEKRHESKTISDLIMEIANVTVKYRLFNFVCKLRFIRNSPTFIILDYVR